MTTPGQGQIANPPSTAKKPLHSLFETIVFVDIGPERKRYGIHKGLLCSRSDYFKAALTGNFQEAKDQVVTLDDEDPETFQRFNAWLYTDVLVEDADLGTLPWSFLIDIYIFAEKRIIPLLQNAAIDAMIRANANEAMPAIQTRDAWSRTAETSLLRKYVVDTRLYESDEFFTEQFTSQVDQYDITFVAAVAIRAVELITLEYHRPKTEADTREDIAQWLCVLKDPWEVRCKRYHVHEPSDPPCEGAF